METIKNKFLNLETAEKNIKKYVKTQDFLVKILNKFLNLETVKKFRKIFLIKKPLGKHKNKFRNLETAEKN